MIKPYLFLMLGFPGSGKSYFAERLAREMSALHLNSDAMRLAIFGSRDETDRIYHSDSRPVLNTYTFGAMNCATKSALNNGISVVYDANNNSIQERADIAASLENNTILPVVVWVSVPKEVAIQRVISRRETENQRQLSEEDAQIYIDKIDSTIEAPIESENVIKIEGTKQFEEQYESFKKQLMSLRSDILAQT